MTFNALLLQYLKTKIAKNFKNFVIFFKNKVIYES